MRKKPRWCASYREKLGFELLSLVTHTIRGAPAHPVEFIILKVMGGRVISIDKNYQTQPPVQLSNQKVDSVLEYLAFTGSPLTILINRKDGSYSKIEERLVVLDVFEDFVQIQLPKNQVNLWE